MLGTSMFFAIDHIFVFMPSSLMDREAAKDWICMLSKREFMQCIELIDETLKCEQQISLIDDFWSGEGNASPKTEKRNNLFDSLSNARLDYEGIYRYRDLKLILDSLDPEKCFSDRQFVASTLKQVHGQNWNNDTFRLHSNLPKTREFFSRIVAVRAMSQACFFVVEDDSPAALRYMVDTKEQDLTLNNLLNLLHCIEQSLDDLREALGLAKEQVNILAIESGSLEIIAAAASSLQNPLTFVSLIFTVLTSGLAIKVLPLDWQIKKKDLELKTVDLELKKIDLKLKRRALAKEDKEEMLRLASDVLNSTQDNEIKGLLMARGQTLDQEGTIFPKLLAPPAEPPQDEKH